MSLISDDSLARFKIIAEANPATSLILRRTLANTYEEFIDVLYKDLDQLIQVLQERKQIYYDAKEDEITMYLVDMLKQRQYRVEHDTKIGGHVDIVIRGTYNEFLWLGEAKRDGGSGWLEEGMQQLCTRYSDGTEGRNHGGIIVYVQGKFASRIFQNWRDRLALTTDFDEIKITDCTRNPSAAFVSTHNHETSGRPYYVRHMSVALFHKPLK